jgi:hypothetical protein
MSDEPVFGDPHAGQTQVIPAALDPSLADHGP